jgi:hypothetical protein
MLSLTVIPHPEHFRSAFALEGSRKHSIKIGKIDIIGNEKFTDTPLVYPGYQ